MRHAGTEPEVARVCLAELFVCTCPQHPSSVTSHRQLETGHGESTSTMEMSKCYKLESFPTSPPRAGFKHLPTHHCMQLSMQYILLLHIFSICRLHVTAGRQGPQVEP